jgi:hypothetical protein
MDGGISVIVVFFALCLGAVALFARKHRAAVRAFGKPVAPEPIQRFRSAWKRRPFDLDLTGFSSAGSSRSTEVYEKRYQQHDGVWTIRIEVAKVSRSVVAYEIRFASRHTWLLDESTVISGWGAKLIGTSD